MHHTFFARHKFHKTAKIFNTFDCTFIGFTNFGFFNHPFNNGFCFFNGIDIGRGNGHFPIIININNYTCFFNNCTNGFSARSNDPANFINRYKPFNNATRSSGTPTH